MKFQYLVSVDVRVALGQNHLGGLDVPLVHGGAECRHPVAVGRVRFDAFNAEQVLEDLELV